MKPMICKLLEEQGAAYVLGALEPAEREALETHAERCPPCARELAELRQVTAQLALSLPQHDPPPALGSRILAIATADAESQTVGAQQAAPGISPLADDPPAPSALPVQLDAPPTARRVRRIPWLSIGALAAALAALLWGAALQVQLLGTRQQLAETGGQLERLRGAYATVVEVLASPDTRVSDLQAREGAPSAQGKVWVDGGTGHGMMMARDLPALPEGQAYQVWLANPQGRVSGGFLRPYDNDTYYVVLQAPDPLTNYLTIGVTREPAGGSPGPTGPRIIGGNL